MAYMRRHAPLDDHGRPFARLQVELVKIKAREWMIDEYAVHATALDLAIETAVHVYGYRSPVGVVNCATEIMQRYLRWEQERRAKRPKRTEQGAS